MTEQEKKEKKRQTMLANRINKPPTVWSEDKMRHAETLAKMQCTQGEICAELGVSVNTFMRIIKEYHGEDKITCFRDWHEMFMASGRIKLRRLQWESAEKGDVAMQKWLGKQILGQREHPEYDRAGEQAITGFIIETLPPKQIGIANEDEDSIIDIEIAQQEVSYEQR